GKRMKVKSGAVTCWPNPKTADNTNVQTARRTRRGTVFLLKPGKLKLLDGDAKPLLRAALFLYFYTLKLTDSLFFSLFLSAFDRNGSVSSDIFPISRAIIPC